MAEALSLKMLTVIITLLLWGFLEGFLLVFPFFFLILGAMLMLDSLGAVVQMPSDSM